MKKLCYLGSYFTQCAHDYLKVFNCALLTVIEFFTHKTFTHKINYCEVPERILSEESWIFLVQILVQNIGRYYLSCHILGREVSLAAKTTNINFTVNVSRPASLFWTGRLRVTIREKIEILRSCYGRKTRHAWHAWIFTARGVHPATISGRPRLSVYRPTLLMCRHRTARLI